MADLTNGVAITLLWADTQLVKHVVSFHRDVDLLQLSQPTRAIPQGFRDPSSTLPKGEATLVAAQGLIQGAIRTHRPGAPSTVQAAADSGGPKTIQNRRLSKLRTG